MATDYTDDTDSFLATDSTDDTDLFLATDDTDDTDLFLATDDTDDTDLFLATDDADDTGSACWSRRAMRIAALLVAVFTIVVGIMGLVSPNSLTTIRREYFATPARLYAAGALRVAMGVVVILVAPRSRAPKSLRVLGAVMCMQGLTATLLGPERAKVVLEWETMQGTALLRVGAAVALAAGCFMAFAVAGDLRRPRNKVVT